MMPLLLILLSLMPQARASFPELFGASAGNIAIGNQADMTGAGNNAYAGALQGFTRTTQWNLSLFYVDTDFQEVEGVVTRNETNTVNDFQTGNSKVNNTPTTMFAFHLSTPLFDADGPKFFLSLFAPASRLLEANTGDPYQPRYVMYDSRFIRPIIILGGAQDFGDWSFSLAAQNGFQSAGDTYFMTRTTAGNPSMAKLSFNYKPTLGVLASAAHRHHGGVSYFNFQQEMKSELSNRTTGETEIASNSAFPFDLDVYTLLYYDPMTFRLGHHRDLERMRLSASLEYQVWEGYENSTIQITKNGGQINGSADYDSLDLRNIFIPKLGLQYRWSDRFTHKAGYFFRPSPLKTSALSGPGNSIDVNKHVFSVGTGWKFQVGSKVVTLDGAYQAHLLEDEKVTKSPGREDGDPAQPKIGSPGYRIGGMIHVLCLGLSWML